MLPGLKRSDLGFLGVLRRFVFGIQLGAIRVIRAAVISDFTSGDLKFQSITTDEGVATSVCRLSRRNLEIQSSIQQEADSCKQQGWSETYPRWIQT